MITETLYCISPPQTSSKPEIIPISNNLLNISITIYKKITQKC